MIHLEKARRCLFAFLHLSIVIQSLSDDQLCKGQIAELPTILDTFYTSITSDYLYPYLLYVAEVPIDFLNYILVIHSLSSFYFLML